jgi:MFS family permease
LRETPVFEEISRMEQLSEGLPVKAVLRRHRSELLLSALLTWTLTAAIMVVILMTPTLLPKLTGVSTAQALQANSLATLMLTLSCPLMGLAVDRFGPVRVLTIGGLALGGATYALYLGAAIRPDLLKPLYGLAGFWVGVISVVPVVMVRAFPPALRFSGLSLSYNAAYALFGGLTPLLVSLMMRTDSLAPAHYVMAICLLGIAVLALNQRKAAVALASRGGDFSLPSLK